MTEDPQRRFRGEMKYQHVIPIARHSWTIFVRQTSFLRKPPSWSSRDDDRKWNSKRKRKVWSTRV